MFSLLRRNRDIRLLFSAQVVSYLGDWFTFVALAGLVEDLTGSKFLVSLVLVAFTLPGFLMSPVAGSVADRFDRRRIVVIVSLAQAVAALGLLLVGAGTVWLAFICQGLITALASFVGPATGAAVPNLVDNDDDLRRANSLFGSTWGVMLALGAGIGGLFASAFGRDAAFVADAVSFVVAAVLIATIRRPMQEERDATAARKVRPVADMAEAVRLARSDKVILALLASKMTFAVGAGLAFSVCYLGAGVSPALWVACLCVGCAHLGGGAQWTLSTMGLQMESPDSLRGRVLAGDFALVTLMLSVTSILAGLVSQRFGVRPTVIVFSLLAASASITYLVATAGIRRRLRSEPSPR